MISSHPIQEEKRLIFLTILRPVQAMTLHFPPPPQPPPPPTLPTPVASHSCFALLSGRRNIRLGAGRLLTLDVGTGLGV